MLMAEAPASAISIFCFLENESMELNSFNLFAIGGVLEVQAFQEVQLTHRMQ